jgi:hypothetical protein
MVRNTLLAFISNKRKELYRCWIHLRNEYFYKQPRIAEIKEGDILNFKNAGAYCFLYGGTVQLSFKNPLKFYLKTKRSF